MIPLYTITQVKKKKKSLKPVRRNISQSQFKDDAAFFFTAGFAHIEIYDDKIINYNAIKHSEKY